MEPPPRTLPLVVIKKPSSLLLLDEGIAVEFLDDVRLGGAAADVVEDHQPGERAAVDEHDLRVDLAGVVDRLAGERACRHEHPLPRPSAVEGSDKLVDVGAADRAGPALCLEVDRLEAEPILFAVFAEEAWGLGLSPVKRGWAQPQPQRRQRNDWDCSSQIRSGGRCISPRFSPAFLTAVGTPFPKAYRSPLAR